MKIAPATVTTTTLTKLRQMASDGYCRLLTWDNLVLMARFDKGSTLLVTNRGEVLKNNQPLGATFNEFAYNNYCFEADIMAAYELLKCPYRGLVEGKHRLVPTCGLHAPDLVFYNASYLEDYVSMNKEDCMLLNFHTTHCDLHIQLPVCKSGFETRLNAADRVSAMQLDHLHHLMHHYGVPHECPPSLNIYQHRDWLREQSHIFQEHCFARICSLAFEDYYGEPLSDGLKAAFLAACRRVFQQKC